MEKPNSSELTHGMRIGTGGIEELPESDPISPSHYQKGAIQPIDFIESQGMGFHEANAVKYITRWKYKNGTEDLLKAIWYLERLLEYASK